MVVSGVAPAGVIGNVVITPLLELVALPLGLIGVLAWEVAPPAGHVIFEAASQVIAAADGLAAQLERIAPVGAVGIASQHVAIALWLVATAACAAARRRWVLPGASVLLVALWRLAPLSPPDGVRVTFLDVGQGDAALIEVAEQLWLVDAGGNAGAATVRGAAAPGRAIRQYLTLRRRQAIDVVLISHPHPDHYLGLLALVEETPAVAIRQVWLPPGWQEEEAAPLGTTSGAAAPSFSAVIEALRRAGAVVRPAPERGVAHAGAWLELLAPRAQLAPGHGAQLAADPVRSVNDNSVVAALRYAGRTVLLAGDIELEGEEVLLDEVGASVRSDVIKVPHHGSRTSSSAAFVDATGARLAIISCGAGNRFGFPAAPVLERWQEIGARVLRTDSGGAVRVEISRVGEVSVDRP